MCYPEIGFGIMGYSEYSFYQLFNALFNEGNIEDVNALFYRKGGKVMKNRLDYGINLDDLPIPNRNLVKYRSYRWPVMVIIKPLKHGETV